MRVALLYNAKPVGVQSAGPDDMFEEYDTETTINGIVTALSRIDMEVEPVVADAALPWRLAEEGFDFAFNIAEGSGRRSREAIPAAVCELRGIPFTGSDSVTLGMTLDKFIAKRVVSPDIPVARGVLIERDTDELGLSALHYPVIVKPNDEGSSKGIRENPVFNVKSAVQRAAGRGRNTPALCWLKNSVWKRDHGCIDRKPAHGTDIGNDGDRVDH
jgi:D-alanine-D-alanine ligase